MSLDPRLTPARPDLAAEALRGRVEAAAWAEPTRRRVTAGLLDLRARPDAAALASQLLFGEAVDVYEQRDGLAWVQAARDGYVGYAEADGLGAPGPAPTHRVRAILSHLYPAPDIKTAPRAVLPMNAALSGRIEGDFLLCEEGAVPAAHVAPAQAAESDWVAVAESFLGAPYLWGGRSALGIDCSGLVQLARHAAGFACPRDSDMQEALGAPAPENALRRGDLVFWRGHVGIMLDGARLLHANAGVMAVAVERLAAAVARIEAAGDGRPTAFRRLPAA